MECFYINVLVLLIWIIFNYPAVNYVNLIYEQ